MRFTCKQLLFLFLFTFPLIGLGQACFDYHKSACFPEPSRFTYEYNNYSVSFQFKAGQARSFTVKLYAGKDYRITLCGDEVFNGVISFKIQREDGKVIYDNSTQDYILNTEFSSIKSQNVDFVIEAPQMISPDGFEIEGCIGVLIEDMVTIKTGF